MDKKILNNLESLPFFTKMAILSLKTGKDNAVNQNIKRWVNAGVIIRLKNGLYVTKTFVDRNMREPAYVELVANKLLAPSYLSLEYVLQKHNLLTEATFGITSVTLKSTRSYTNPLGTFKYRTLNEKLYFGFRPKRFGKNIIYEASLAKAVFDHLYLRLPELDPLVPSSIDELRLNWDEMRSEDMEELVRMTGECKIKKMVLIVKYAKEHLYGNAR